LAFQAIIGIGNAPFVEKIRQKYPIGNDACWPTKRVYTSADGRSWELNDLRMQVWANHLVCSLTASHMWITKQI
jgi:hypothetical protein